MKNISMNELSKSLESLYLGGKYSEYQKLLLEHKSQFSPSTFHYNLGTCLTKMGNAAAGRFHLEKSLRLGQVDSKVFYNLQTAKEMLQVHDLDSSPVMFDRMLSYSLDLPSSVYLMMTLVLLVISLLIVRVKVLAKKWLPLLLIVSVFPILLSTLYLDRMSFAITLKESPLREGPSKVFSEFRKLPAGSKVVIGEHRKEWFFIKLPRSLSGWIHKDSLGIL
jgi:hypothetical protein